MLDLEIRPERGADAAAVRALVSAAFGADSGTADFVGAVRAEADECLAEVAVLGGAIVGHAQWCAAPLFVDGRRVKGAYLTSLSAKPDLQRRGVGSRLVRSGLGRLDDLGFKVASLLGDPAYYGRFGFSPDLAARIEAPHRSRGPGFQAIELAPGALGGKTVRADFPAVISPDGERSDRE
jgi:putative acetyltransferase